MEKAMSAARRVVGAMGPAEANNGDDSAEDGMTTSSGETDSSTSPADEEEADKHAASNDWGVTESVGPSVPTVSRLQSARSARERPMARVAMAVPLGARRTSGGRGGKGRASGRWCHQSAAPPTKRRHRAHARLRGGRCRPATERG